MLSSLPEVQAYTLERVHPLPAVKVGLLEALGMVTALPIVSEESVPPFDNSAMDGYAVKAADTTGTPVSLQVMGTANAGHQGEVAMLAGQAIRIMTGAPIPNGGDAVVPLEQTITEDDRVTIQTIVGPGSCVRKVGSDVQPGVVVAAQGTVLQPSHLGVFASIGIDRVSIHPTPRVGVLSTGDELVAGGPLKPGQIRDSNRITLLALVHQAGFEAFDFGVVADDSTSLKERIEAAAASCDAIVTSGGVSVGDRDYLRIVLSGLGELYSAQIAIKPARPFAFAMVAAVPVFALPGNPVAALVSFELLVRPALRRMAGHTNLYRRVVAAVASEPFRRNPDGKTHFPRVIATQRRDHSWTARPSGTQDSHHLAATSAANALAVLDDGCGADAGDTIAVMLLD